MKPSGFSTSPSVHQDILDAASKLESVNKLNEAYLQKLIKKILNGRIPDELIDWIKHAKTSFIFNRHSDEDLAFHWLTLQKKEWLNSFAEFISSLWYKSWLTTNKLSNGIILRIKSLVENTKCGVSIPLLDNYLLRFEDKNLVLAEINTYLLIAKVEENEGRLDTRAVRWDNVKYHSHLAVVFLYIHRKNSELDISNVLFELSDMVTSPPSDNKLILSEIEALFVTYLKQGIYSNLINGKDRDYLAFKSSIAPKVITCEWLATIIEQALDAPGLEEIKKKLNKIIKSSKKPSFFDQNHDIEKINALI